MALQAEAQRRQKASLFRKGRGDARGPNQALKIMIETLSILDNMDKKETPMKITSTEFQQNIGRYQDAAQLNPVSITKNGRVHTVLVSSTFFELLTKGRVARLVENLDDDTLRAIASSAVPPEFAHLDSLVKDWTP